jgi:hypothetical protein
MEGSTMRTSRTIGWLFSIGVFVGTGTVLLAQCPSGAVCVDTDDNFDRLNGNAVQGHVETSLFGDLQYYFYPSVAGQEDKDGSVLSTSSLIWGAQGGVIRYNFASITLSSSGPGTYTATGYHEIYCPTSLCGSEVYYPPYTDGWNGYDAGSLSVQRPTVSGQPGLWWLGGGPDNPNSLYNQGYMSVTTNCSSCSETPHWTVTANPSKVSLSCTDCSTLIITTQQPSSSIGDVHIQASIGGFPSDTFQFTVNQPRALVSQGISDSASGATGYQSLLYYTTIEDAYGSPFASIGINEQFGSFTADTTNNWPTPTAGGIATYSGTWWDTISVACGSPCGASPLPLPPSGLSNPVMHATQTWRAGSATLGTGVVVQVDTIQYYTDHGRHN